ncbi:MAG: glycosyltransferase family 4 protein [Chloroflexota bacterium]
MRILFLTQVLPYPLDAGPKIRAYYVLRHLAQTHQVTLVSFVRQTDTPEAIGHLKSFCKAVHTARMPRGRLRDIGHVVKSMVSNQPFLIVRDQVEPMKALLAEMVEQHGPFDAVHSDQLWMASYALFARQQSTPGAIPLTILDKHNAVYLVPKRLLANERNPLMQLLMRMETRKMLRYEVETCNRFDHVTWVTEDDYTALSGAAPSGKAVPNSAVIPICGEAEDDSTIVPKPLARRVTFIGGLHYPPNAQGISWYAQHIFPLVYQAIPDAILTIIGKDPPKSLSELDIPDKNLEIAGYVDELQPYLEETAVFIVPLLAGGGMRVKILDAWRWQLPVVSTTIGAEGLQITPHENILLADTPVDFAQATIHLIQNRSLAREIAEAGRRQFERGYSWRTAYRRWNKIYPAIDGQKSLYP